MNLTEKEGRELFSKLKAAKRPMRRIDLVTVLAVLDVTESDIVGIAGAGIISPGKGTASNATQYLPEHVQSIFLAKQALKRKQEAEAERRKGMTVIKRGQTEKINWQVVRGDIRSLVRQSEKPEGGDLFYGNKMGLTVIAALAAFEQSSDVK